MFQPIVLSLWVLRRRLRSAWGLLALSSLGTMAAVVLLSSTALYSQVLAEAGVRHSLYSSSPTSLHVQTLVQNRPLDPDDYAELRRVAETTVERRIGYLKTDLQRYGRTQTGMAATKNPAAQPPPLGSPSGRPFFMTEFVEHSRLLEGDWPQQRGTSGPDGVELEAVVGVDVADDFGYAVGTRLYITPFRAAPEERIVLNIVGVAAPLDPREEFWLGAPTQFSVQIVGEILVIPAYVTEQDFLQVLGRRFPIAVGDFGFNVFVNPAGISAETVDTTQLALDGLETDLNKVYPRTLVLSRLGLTLEEFKRDLTLARVPVYVFGSLVVIVVLFFLGLMGAILARSQSDELGMLMSRGANVIQVCTVWLLAEAVLALVAVGIGPLFAWLIVRFLLLPTFGELGGGPIEISLYGEMFLFGAVGAALSVLVLGASVAGRARTSMSDSLSSRSRPPTLSFFHRYYLDLVLLLVVALVWWQFQEREGFVSRAVAARGLDVDPMLVLGPVLGLLGAALLMMRALPMLVRLVVWLCMRAGPGWSSITLARVGRNPVLPSTLAVLLMLATALGVFGATFQSSLSRSQSDQTLYRIGGDVRVTGPGVRTDLAERLEQVQGVEAATPVLRDSVTLVEGHTSLPALLIAAEPQALGQSAWFREDFSALSLAELATLIEAVKANPGDAGFGVPLPPDSNRIGVWLETGDLTDRDLQADINIWARLVSSTSRYRNVSMGAFGGISGEAESGWSLFAEDLPDSVAASSHEWSLAAIFFTTSSFTKVTAGRIHLDDFTAFGPKLAEEGVIVEDFEHPRQWTPLGITGGAPDSVQFGPDGAYTESAGATFFWDEPIGGEQRGVHISPVQLPIPAIGGAGLYPGQAVRIGHGLSSIPVQVVGTSDLFPTITSFRRPFLVLDLDAYLSYLKILPPSGTGPSLREIWLSLDSTRDRESVIADVTSVLPILATVSDRNEKAEQASRNPLAGGGWNGLTGLSMAGIGLAVVTALLLYSAASVRAARVDTAVAKAMGLSRVQLFLSQAAERWLLGGVAIVAGAAMGYWPGLELVQLLDVTPNGASPVPPMIPDVHWLLLISVLAGLSTAVMLSAVFAALLARNLNPVDVLREGS